MLGLGPGMKGVGWSADSGWVTVIVPRLDQVGGGPGLRGCGKDSRTGASSVAAGHRTDCGHRRQRYRRAGDSL
ncbi:hypothetical protein Kosp01_16470 [Kocuria sp. NBRC 114282]|nr:hypothetical protein Kosp01_16470 [Kocuria sp. NBRC 114282]